MRRRHDHQLLAGMRHHATTYPANQNFAGESVVAVGGAIMSRLWGVSGDPARPVTARFGSASSSLRTPLFHMVAKLRTISRDCWTLVNGLMLFGLTQTVARGVSDFCTIRDESSILNFGSIERSWYLVPGTYHIGTRLGTEDTKCSSCRKTKTSAARIPQERGTSSKATTTTYSSVRYDVIL